MTEKEFVSYIGQLAAEDMKKTGILASITAAQAILESGYGSSELARNANNLFGMKANLSGNTWPSDWGGQTYTKETGEQKPSGERYTITAAFRKYADHAASIKDHSDYLAGAKNGSALRYEGIVGERDYTTAAKIIKSGGYATSIDYVSKLCNIIKKWNLTQYDKIEEGENKLQIIEATMKNSPCYTSGREITVNGMYAHSVGCPCEKAKNIINNMNKSSAGAGVHAVIQPDGKVYIGLPITNTAKRKAIRNWHCGSGSKGSGNNTHIGVELTEPATIKYTGGANWIETGDGSNTKSVVLANYKNAVEYFALRCKELNLDPMSDGVIISHAEGHKRGYASNHGDVEHMWSKFGLTMDQFRKDVKAKMAGDEISVTGSVTPTTTADQKINSLSGTVTVIYDGYDGLNIRNTPTYGDNVEKIVGAGQNYKVTGISADEKWYQIDDAGAKRYITAIPDYVKFKATAEQKASTAGSGYYRVRKDWNDAGSQIGAFKVVENAVELAKQNSGYYVFDPNDERIYPAKPADTSAKPYKVKVNIPDLRIRKGAGTTFDYWKKDGEALHTGEGVFTIVKEADGPGASKWGLLKSYEDNEDGWISLDYTTET